MFKSGAGTYTMKRHLVITESFEEEAGQKKNADAELLVVERVCQIFLLMISDLELLDQSFNSLSFRNDIRVENMRSPTRFTDPKNDRRGQFLLN